MKLYDYLVAHDEDYDVWDTEIDDCVTVCLPDLDKPTKWDDYDRFIIEVTKKVDFVSECQFGIVGNWYGFIWNNRERLAKFSRAFWEDGMCPYDDEEDDDFICDWLSHIHYMCAGYGNDEYYSVLLKMISKCRG